MPIAHGREFARWRVTAILAIALARTSFGRAEGPPAPPVAKRVLHHEVRHGETVADEYFWLREKSNPEVIEYLEAENAYTETMTSDLKPFVETLYREMLGRIKQTDLSVPARRGTHYYYSRTSEGQQYPIECRRKGSLTAAEEVLLDANQLTVGHPYFSLSGMTVSDDENRLAYTTDTTGFRQFSLHVKDLRTGEMLPDTAERVTSVQWAADNQTLFYTTEDPTTKRSDTLWRYVLGSAKPEQVYVESDELYRLHANRTRDKKFVLLQINSSDTSEVRYVPCDEPQRALRVLLPREKNHRYFVDHRQGLFYIRTNKDAKNFRIVTAPVSDPGPPAWQTFVPSQNDISVEGMDLFQGFALVRERADGLSTFRWFDFDTGQWNRVQFPEPVYAAFPAENPEFDAAVFRYNYQSLVTPPCVFDLDVKTHESTLLKQQEVLGGYDSRQYLSERLWVTARDGVRIPVSIVTKKGHNRDGRAPLFLYAYGSYGTGVPPSFARERLSLLDRGMAFAIAHVRGGNELGEAWRDGGMLMQKKNTFHDFIDCAEYLVKEKWTSPERLAIQGFSAGGLLMGAVVNMRPDLFRAVHAGVPFVDVMNTMLDATLPLTVGEYLVWGDPREKPAYDYMKSYSPYDNLQRRDYPALLVTTGLNDSQVMYWEPAKYVARLRALKTDANPLLLKTNMEAGHGGSSGRYDRLREQAFEYAWLMSQVGITN